jgi:hypothetical protein
MTRNRSTIIVSCLAGSLLAAGSVPATVVDFEDCPLPGPQSSFNGDPGTLQPGQSRTQPWASRGASFANTFGIDGDYNFPYWDGFAYSNVVNTTDGSFTNQYASYPGGGFGSSTYAVAYSDAAAVELPGPSTVGGFRIANTTYTYLTLVNGDQWGFTSPLPAGGWFRVTASGRLAGVATGSATFNLADLRGAAPAGILAGWTWFDLSALGTVDRVEFAFAGSDTGTYGLNTPAYFAMDDLTFAAVPEPAAGMLAAAVAAAVLRWRRRRR